MWGGGGGLAPPLHFTLDNHTHEKERSCQEHPPKGVRWVGDQSSYRQCHQGERHERG